MVTLGAIAIVVVVVVGVMAFRRLTSARELRGADAESNDAAKQYEEMKERQRNIAGFWGGFLP
jgi:hypothetical protein